jgi:hypothetical protein
VPGSLPLPLRPGVDEALVRRCGVLGGDALGVLGLGQAAGLPEDDVDEVAEEALADAERLVELLDRLAIVVGLEDGGRVGVDLAELLMVPPDNARKQENPASACIEIY